MSYIYAIIKAKDPIRSIDGGYHLYYSVVVSSVNRAIFKEEFY